MKSDEKTTPLAVNCREAAAMLGISERLLWSWTRVGAIPHVRIGTRVLYPVDALRKWLESQSCTPAQKPTEISTTKR